MAEVSTITVLDSTGVTREVPTLLSVEALLPAALHASGGLKTTLLDSAGVAVDYAGASTGTQSIVAGSATDVTILASNASRKGAAVFNDGAAYLYLLVGSGTSSATVFTIRIDPYGYYEVPATYTGVLKGLWASATGSARVTEFS